MEEHNHRLLQAGIVLLIALIFVIQGSAMQGNQASLSKNKATYTHVQGTSNPQATGTTDVLTEGFEAAWVADSDGDLAPPGWEVHNTCQQTSPYDGYWNQIGEVVFSDGTVTPPEGVSQAFVYWSYDHQDEWLVTPEITIGGAAALTFMFYGHCGSTYLDHYYVKISPNGGSDPADFTDVLWDASALPEEDNHYNTPVTVDIAGYSGNVRLAWEIVDGDGAGLWYATFIDQVSVTSSDDTIAPVTTCAITGTNPVTITLTATDDMSGVAYTKYKIDDGTFADYTGPITYSVAGDHVITFYSADIAGNVEDEKTQSFSVGAPVTITIKGGLGITATVHNDGSSDVEVSGTINVTGLVFPKSKAVSGTVPAGGDLKLKDMVFGFGKTTITVTLGANTGSKDGTVLLFIVL